MNRRKTLEVHSMRTTFGGFGTIIIHHHFALRIQVSHNFTGARTHSQRLVWPLAISPHSLPSSARASSTVTLQRDTSSFVSKTYFMQDSRTLHTSFGAYSWESKGIKKYSDFSFPAKTNAFSRLWHWLLVSKKNFSFLLLTSQGTLILFHTHYAGSNSIPIC